MSNCVKVTSRYERKFLISDLCFCQVEQIIKLHPGMFTEIYRQRFVNNIYLDTLGLKNYRDNVNGSSARIKCRVRWYGVLFGAVKSPVLEFKIKNGLIGKKESTPLKSFDFKHGFCAEDLKKVISESDLSLIVRERLKNFFVTSVNCYSRKYFLSADKKFRLTVDSEMQWFEPSVLHNTFLRRFSDRNHIVVELKYDCTDDSDAQKITNLFPFRLTKYSKYVSGIEAFVY